MKIVVVRKWLISYFNVDDLLKSGPTDVKAVWIADQLTGLIKEGGFHLTKFSSNSLKLLAINNTSG